MSDERVYLDHAATTPLAPAVLEAMRPFFAERGYNPSGLHAESRAARDALEEARRRVAAVLGCEPGELVFTGSGSEGANLAIKGAADGARRAARNRVVVTPIEHHAVLGAAEYLRRYRDFKVDHASVDANGAVDREAFERLLGADVAVVSVGYANNEVGTVQPLSDLADGVRASGALLHTDAVQAPGALPLDVDALGVDLLSIAAHKFYGPKGVGALYVRRGARVVPQVQGGTQEKGRRAGTENVAGIVGLAAALDLAERNRDANVAHNRALGRRLRAGLAEIDGVRFNGDPERRLANNTSVCIADVKTEGLLLQLDRAGLAVSSGSACTSASLEPSHVLLAMGIAPELAGGSLRITTGPDNRSEDMDRLLEVLGEIVPRLRAGS
ncbi:MAG: cysteine desulfurase family protein [Chloroflexota bacterium]|nr:cysteine desulfurase family protein [Chloroflexota bacterium]MDP6508536.1 cysteine desulfurase family protein [Chloroflexota bacterium]MDP6756872.1 cysteine desulfurase family protein [Chloroflexota bacterium]